MPKSGDLQGEVGKDKMNRNIEELEKEMKVLEYFEEAKYGCVPPAEAERDLTMKTDEIETILLRNGIHINWSTDRDMITTGEKETRDAIGKLEERIARLKREKEFAKKWYRKHEWWGIIVSGLIGLAGIIIGCMALMKQ